MNRYLVLLRGINVGGKNIIKMTDLKASFDEMGFLNVVTYIKSGNVLVQIDYTAAMIEPVKTPQLTPEQRQALDASNGLLQGDSYVLMRNDVVLDWFGYSLDELQKELKPAIQHAQRREFVDFNLESFLEEMHRRPQRQDD